MPYPIIDIEVTQPLPTIQLSENDRGIALIVRRKDLAIAFLMQALPANSTLSAAEIREWITKEVGNKLLQESIRDQLTQPTANMADFPSLTVAVCTKDRPDNLARCLQSLIKLQQPQGVAEFNSHSSSVAILSASTIQKTPHILIQHHQRPTRRFEILVIDNASTDQRTQELVAALPSVRYVQEPKPGLNFARNRALSEATGEVLAFVDDDVVVDRQWLNGLIEAWSENPDAAAFTGQVLPYALETEAQILCEQRGGFRKGFEKIRFGQSLPGNTLYPCGAGVFGVGCNMAFRRQIVLDLGGFDEALDTGPSLPGGGDHDMFYRVIRAGYTLVYEPKYLVFHEHRRDYLSLRRQYSRSWGLGFTSYVSKCYLSDPQQREKLLRLVWWWIKYELRQLLESLLGKNPLSPDIFLAEFFGGIVGLLGGYPRSCKRIEQIRRKFV
ncbi:glycosyltransferase family 2 protein [Nostoc sp. FACHB-110]|uniref:glycosyltransferase family 2 protein n=1 Tax=Nostoc sp. FACHB-110 TaxID=2692834 RepID=UPI001684CC41|nr:glycosyltransferase [Nostoc sp. FACHB-110]MBD2440129.1 glycosyltransferase [Nostoc sp. FACHB-110]